MEPVLVVGAGIAGVACARELSAAGVPVRVLDRGHRVGGRMAEAGASYATVGDPDFADLLEGWQRAGLAREWTDTFTVLEPDRAPQQKSGPVRWAAPGGLRSLVEDLATGLDVAHQDVRRVARADDRLTVDGEPAGAVVLAMPDPQAARLLGPGLEPVVARLDRVYEPVLALSARFERRTWDDVAPGGRFEGAFVNGDTDVDWITDAGRRRGDDAPELVAHSSTDLARAHLERPGTAEPVLREALTRLLGVGAPVEAGVHRWSFAKPAGEREERYLLVDGVGACGDGWGPASKVETAWRSGRDLGRALVDRLS